MPSPKKQSWQNPKDIMRTHRIKRQSSTTKPNLVRSKSASNASTSLSRNEEKSPALQTATSETFTVTASLKRKNPFIRESGSVPATAAKRRPILDCDGLPAASDAVSPTKPDAATPNSLSISPSGGAGDGPGGPIKLLGILKKAEQMTKDEPKSDADSYHRGGSPAQKRRSPQINLVEPSQPPGSNRSQTRQNLSIPFESTQQKNIKAQKHPPTDWSLKTKMRVVVESREESFSRVPGIDAKNVTNYVHQTLENGPDWAELDIFQKLRRCCLHYSYPQVPWLRKFPRLAGEFKSRSSSLFSNNEDILKELQSDWTNVFTSLYQQLRGGICPYFYACTHQFTVLFRCQRVSPEKASISALLSPSTRGFRELLTKDDIEFRLPNIDMHKTAATESTKPKDVHTSKARSESQDIKTVEGDIASKEEKGSDDDSNDEEEEEEDDDINDHHGASKWLEGMGLNKKDFPSLEPLKVKLQRDGFREIDNRPQSMVYVEGGDVHAFFNLLLNYPSCIASSGPQHGLPPTLLSPVPFVGGALVQNSVKHSYLRDVPVKSAGSQNVSYSHVFEISGPILPHHTLNIAAILHDYHHKEGSSVVTFNTHLPSAALNTRAINSVEKDQLAVNWHKLFVDFSLSSPGLMPAVRDRLASEPNLDSGAYVKELRISPQGFSWS